ncbi:hypothetical protein [Citrobacter koseri]|uniref:hypothetical protein n=1 Tax=Citrobacter koseri TaxID=545 RepID=UPI00397898AB
MNIPANMPDGGVTPYPAYGGYTGQHAGWRHKRLIRPTVNIPTNMPDGGVNALSGLQ